MHIYAVQVRIWTQVRHRKGPAEHKHSSTLPTPTLPAGTSMPVLRGWVSCTAVPVFQAGGLGLTSRTTSRARTVRLILSNPELSSFDLKPPTRSYGKRSRPDRHQVATTRVRLHALVVLASSHEPVTNIYLTSGRISRYDTYLQKDTPNRRSVKCRPIERLRATVLRVGSLHLPG